MKELKIIKLILEELEKHIIHLRSPRGYGTGHTYWTNTNTSDLLGDTPYEEETTEEIPSTEKVEISRAFKK